MYPIFKSKIISTACQWGPTQCMCISAYCQTVSTKMSNYLSNFFSAIAEQRWQAHVQDESVIQSGTCKSNCRLQFAWSKYATWLQCPMQLYRPKYQGSVCTNWKCTGLKAHVHLFVGSTENDSHGASGPASIAGQLHGRMLGIVWCLKGQVAHLDKTRRGQNSWEQGRRFCIYIIYYMYYKYSPLVC